MTSLLLLPFAAFVENFKANWVPEFVFSLFWLAVVTSICAYALMFRLIRLSPATRVSSLQYFIPPTTMIIAWLVFPRHLASMDLLAWPLPHLGFILCIWVNGDLAARGCFDIFIKRALVL